MIGHHLRNTWPENNHKKPPIPPESGPESWGASRACRAGICDAWDVYSLGTMTLKLMCRNAWLDHNADLRNKINISDQCEITDLLTSPEPFPSTSLKNCMSLCASSLTRFVHSLQSHCSQSSVDGLTHNFTSSFGDWVLGMLQIDPQMRDSAADARLKGIVALNSLENIQRCSHK